MRVTIKEDGWISTGVIFLILIGRQVFLPKAVSINIQKTNDFFREISALAVFAKQAPQSPINSRGTLFNRLEQRMKLLEAEGSDHFIALSKSLADPKRGCISVGINGAASNACTGFEVRT